LHFFKILLIRHFFFGEVTVDRSERENTGVYEFIENENNEIGKKLIALSINRRNELRCRVEDTGRKREKARGWVLENQMK